MRNDHTERLGTLVSASGEVLILDFGQLGIWSGDAVPHVTDGRFDPELTASMNGSIDYQIVGPDAEAAASALDLAAIHGVYAFDLPPDVTVVHERLAAVCAERGYTTELRPIPKMPHRSRVRTLLDRTPRGTEIPFHGVWAVAVRGVPANTELPVLGQRMDPAGPDTGRWWSVWVQCVDGDVAASEEIGYVLVDEARLMFTDPDALGHWRSDAALLEQMRGSATESGTTELGGTTLTGLFTSWGDGAFPVYRDVDAAGRLIRFRVELGAPVIVRRTRRLEQLWFGDLSKLAIASSHVVAGAPIGWLERDEPRNDDDSGWCVYSGTETQAELDEPGSAELVPLRDLIVREKDLEPLLATPPPAAFERTADGRWARLPDRG